MAQFVVQVPVAYRSKFSNYTAVTVEAESANSARMQLVQYGVPFAAVGKASRGPSPQVGARGTDAFNAQPNSAPAIGLVGKSLDAANNPASLNNFGGNNALPPTSGPAGAAGANAYANAYYGNKAGQPGFSGFGGEESSTTSFAPNVNPLPTSQQVQDALPFTPGTADDPFSQPSQYQRLTPADFAKIRAAASAGSVVGTDDGPGGIGGSGNANQEFDVSRFFGGSFNSDTPPPPPPPPPPPAARGFNDLISDLKTGAIFIYGGGTFDLTPFESPAFWDAVFQDFGAVNPGATYAAQMDAIARQIAASKPDQNGDFEAKKALTEFYKQAEQQINARGLDTLEDADGALLNIRAFNQAKSSSTDEMLGITQEQADKELEDVVKVNPELGDEQKDLDLDPDLGDEQKDLEPDLGSGGGEIGGEGEGFFPDSLTQDLAGNTTDTRFLPSFEERLGPTERGFGASTAGGGGNLVNIQDIIDNFEQANGMPPISQVPRRDPVSLDIMRGPNRFSEGAPGVLPGVEIPNSGEILYETVVNPLLSELLDAANLNNGLLTDQQIADATAKSAVDVAQLQAESAIGVAEANGASDAEVANIRAKGDAAIALAQQGADKYIADQQLAGTQATAGASSDFGFVGQGGTQEQLDSIQEFRNSQIAAELNPFGFTPEQGFGLEQGRVSDNQFGFLQQNLGQGLEQQQNRNALDQVLRGGISPEQQRQLAIANQAGQMQANNLNFISNPSAVGFATEQGLFNPAGGFNLEDINNSPEGQIPGSLFGFNSPKAGGAGGGQTTNTGNFNANTLRNTSDEQLGFLQGAASAGGQTPSEFNASVEAFTPQGI